MKQVEFFTPETVKPLYPEIVPTYQNAFAGEPWFEVSKCGVCESGFSANAAGESCAVCGTITILSEPAYESDELVERFTRLGESRPTSWYIEREKGVVSLAAVAWRACSDQIAEEKYADSPLMREWLLRTIGNKEIIWLDEVFANREVSPRGNLERFDKMTTGMAEALNGSTIAYRTISEQMKRASIRAFGSRAMLYERRVEVPDRRDFVVIKNLGDNE